MLHARYWRYDGESPQVPNTLKYDPHGFGLKTLETMDALINSLGLKQVEGVSLNGVLVNHHKGKLADIGHQVHIAATAEQWEAAKKYWESGAFDYIGTKNMNALTLKDLVSQTDNFEPEAIELVLNRVDEFDALGFGIDVVDWEVIGTGNSKQVGVLFDMKNDRYGYYTDNGQTVLVKLDKTYQELSDWGNCWDDCPEVLKNWD